MINFYSNYILFFLILLHVRHVSNLVSVFSNRRQSYLADALFSSTICSTALDTAILKRPKLNSDASNLTMF